MHRGNICNFKHHHRRRLRQPRRFGTSHPRSNDALICQLPLIKAPRETNISSLAKPPYLIICLKKLCDYIFPLHG